MKAPPKQLLVFDRKFAMPSKHTFTIKPIKELLAEEVGLNNIGWADPVSYTHLIRLQAGTALLFTLTTLTRRLQQTGI